MSSATVGLENAEAVFFRDSRALACDRDSPMNRFTARFDADLAVVARPVAQRVHEEIGHDATEQDGVTLNHRQISGDDAGTTSTDFTVEQVDAVTYKPLEAHRCALERLAMRAGLKEEGFDQEAHARH